MAIRLRTVPSARPALHARLRLARLFALPEAEFAERWRALEADELFRRLRAAGVIGLEPYPRVRFAPRLGEAPAAGASRGDLPPLRDAQGDLVPLLQRVGRERLERLFLRGEAVSDADAALECGIEAREARRIRDYVERLHVHAEFEAPPPAPPPAAEPGGVVAGIEIENGRPAPAFFRREIWKGRYRIDETRRHAFLAALPPAEARRAGGLLSRLGLLERRKTTLYRVLEALLEAQGEYLVTRDPVRRRPLTQRALAARAGFAPSVLNRLITDKSVRLPWGREAPIRALVPSRKTVLREALGRLAEELPELRDEELGRELRRRCGARLSRRSISQYRKELGLGRAGRRGEGGPP